MFKKTGNWLEEDRNFLLKTLEVGGPTVADLSSLVTQGLEEDDILLYFKELKAYLEAKPYDFKPFIDKLLALKTHKNRFTPD